MADTAREDLTSRFASVKLRMRCGAQRFLWFVSPICSISGPLGRRDQWLQVLFSALAAKRRQKALIEQPVKHVCITKLMRAPYGGCLLLEPSVLEAPKRASSRRTPGTRSATSPRVPRFGAIGFRLTPLDFLPFWAESAKLRIAQNLQDRGHQESGIRGSPVRRSDGQPQVSQGLQQARFICPGCRVGHRPRAQAAGTAQAAGGGKGAEPAAAGALSF